MAATKQQYELAVRITGMVEGSLGKAAQLTKKQIRDIARAAANAGGSAVSFTDAMEKAGPGIDKAWGGITAVAKTGAAAMAAVGAAAVAAGKAAVDEGSEFEKAMSSWSATASATQEEYETAREAALLWGRQTTKTATESANALEYMALAGWSVEDSVSALPHVLKLAEATGLDLARTSDLVTDSMSATGTSIEELGRFLDVSAKANNKSNQTAEMLLDAWTKSGGVLKGLNVGIEDSATALGVMANRGIKASEAGTALNALLINLTTGTGQAGKKMGELGISAFDADGRFIGLKETLETVNEATRDMTEEERNAAFAAIGGKHHVDALNDLMQGLNATVADGRTEWDALNDELRDAEGALDQMADAKMDNLWGDMEILKSAMSDMKIHIYDGLRDPIRDTVQEMTGMITASGGIVDTLADSYPTIKRYAKDGMGAVSEAMGPLIGAGKWLISNPQAFSPIIGLGAGLATTIGALEAVRTGTAAISGLSGTVGALMSNPVTAALGISSAAVGGIVAVQTAMKTYNAAMARKDLAGRFGDITLSLTDLQDAATAIIGKDTMGRLAASMDQINKVTGIQNNLQGYAKDLDKLAWKVNVGHGLTESDLSSLKTSIDGLVRESIDLVESQQYSVHLSVKALFGEGSEEGEGILAGLDSFYAGIEGQVAALGEKLGKAYSKAMEDGIIDLDEMKLISELEAELTRITDAVANAQEEVKWKRIEDKYYGRPLSAESFLNLESELGERVAEANAEAEAAHDNVGAALQAEYDSTRNDTNEGLRRRQELRGQMEQNDSAYRAKRAENVGRAAGYSIGTVQATYGDYIDAYAEELYSGANERIKYALEQYQSSGMGISLDELLGHVMAGSGKEADAVKILLDEAEPVFSQMEELAEEFRAHGEEMPKALAEGMANIDLIMAAAGDVDALYSIVAGQILQSPELAEIYENLKETGYMFPEKLEEAIEEKSQDAANAAAETLYSDAKDAIDGKFSGGIETETEVKVEPHVSLQGDIVAMIHNKVQAAADGASVSVNAGVNVGALGGGMAYSGKSQYKPKNAFGGYYTSATDIRVAEAGDNEYAIPVNSSLRAASLWEEAGRELMAAGAPVHMDGGLGSMARELSALSGNSGGMASVTYSPTINIQGSADRAAVKSALQDGYRQFVGYMEQYRKQQRRVSV